MDAEYKALPDVTVSLTEYVSPRVTFCPTTGTGGICCKLVNAFGPQEARVVNTFIIYLCDLFVHPWGAQCSRLFYVQTKDLEKNPTECGRESIL